MLMELINNPDMYVIITAEDLIEFGFMVVCFVFIAEAVSDVICKGLNKLKHRK